MQILDFSLVLEDSDGEIVCCDPHTMELKGYTIEEDLPLPFDPYAEPFVVDSLGVQVASSGPHWYTITLRVKAPAAGLLANFAQIVH